MLVLANLAVALMITALQLGVLFTAALQLAWKTASGDQRMRTTA